MKPILITNTFTRPADHFLTNDGVSVTLSIHLDSSQICLPNWYNFPGKILAMPAKRGKSVFSKKKPHHPSWNRPSNSSVSCEIIWSTKLSPWSRDPQHRAHQKKCWDLEVQFLKTDVVLCFRNWDSDPSFWVFRSWKKLSDFIFEFQIQILFLRSWKKLSDFIFKFQIQILFFRSWKKLSDFIFELQIQILFFRSWKTDQFLKLSKFWMDTVLQPRTAKSL